MSQPRKGTYLGQWYSVLEKQADGIHESNWPLGSSGDMAFLEQVLAASADAAGDPALRGREF
jgi:hypothetical protein